MKKMLLSISIFLVVVFLSTSVFAEDPYEVAWIRQMGTPSSDVASSVAIDSSGNAYVAGYTWGGLDGNTTAGQYDLFLVKYDPRGTKIWTRQMGSAGYDVAKSVAVDGAGNAYVAGYTEGGLDGNEFAGYTDLFLVKYDTNGTKLWTRQMGTTVYDYAYSVAVDGMGNAYVAGYTSGGLDGNTKAGWSYDFFLVKYDPSGVKLWTRQMGTARCDNAFSVAVDNAGNAFVAGWTEDGLDGNAYAGSGDIFLVKYDPTGTKLWTRQMGTEQLDVAYSVAVDGSGNAYVTGNTLGELDGNANAGGADLFLVKYDTNGTKLWTRQMGSTDHDYAYSVAVDGMGNAYVAGYTEGGLDGNTKDGWGCDFFLVKYDSSGTKLWTRQMGSAVHDYAHSVAVDGTGNVYVAGSTNGWLDGNINAGGYDLFLVRFNAPSRDATIQDLIALITEMLNSGGIANKGLATSLTNMMGNAQSSLEQGNVTAAGNMLNAFVNHVEAQSGKGITEEAAASLIEAANQILKTLQP